MKEILHVSTRNGLRAQLFLVSDDKLSVTTRFKKRWMNELMSWCETVNVLNCSREKKKSEWKGVSGLNHLTSRLPNSPGNVQGNWEHFSTPRKPSKQKQSIHHVACWCSAACLLRWSQAHKAVIITTHLSVNSSSTMTSTGESHAHLLAARPVDSINLHTTSEDGTLMTTSPDCPSSCLLPF